MNGSRKAATRFTTTVSGLAAVLVLSGCGGGGGGQAAPAATTAPAGPEATVVGSVGADPSTDVSAPGPFGTAGDFGSGSAEVASTIAGTGTPLGTEDDGGDGVRFVTTTSTTTLPPTTTSTTSTTTTTTSTTTTTTTSTTTSTTTTVPPPTTIRCSFAADALFEPGQAVLADAAVAEIAAAVSGIAEIRGVTVEGHTDHRGSNAENLALSQARADAAAVVLVASGIDASSITAVGLGESAAHQGTPTDAEMAADRRVDVVVDADVAITTTC